MLFFFFQTFSVFLPVFSLLYFFFFETVNVLFSLCLQLMRFVKECTSIKSAW